MTFRLKFPFTLVETQTGRIAGCSSCGSMWKSTISILSAVPLPKFMVVNWRFRWRSPRLNNCNNPDGEKVDNLMKILWYDYGKKLWYLRTVTLHNPEMYCHIFEGHSPTLKILPLAAYQWVHHMATHPVVLHRGWVMNQQYHTRDDITNHDYIYDYNQAEKWSNKSQTIYISPCGRETK